jgi:hypothetical protein
LGYQNGAELAIYDSKIYGIVNDMGSIKVAAFDSSSGQLLYKTAALDGGLVQQHGLFIGNNGTIYLPRSQNNPITDYLYSFTDNGSSFNLNWSLPIDYVPFSSGGVGNDGSIYSYSRSGRVIRIDPLSGTVLDSSLVVLSGNASYPRMTIDAAGRVFVTNGGFSDGNFYSFNADLSLRWQTAIPNVYIGGPIIGWEGTLVICGTGMNIRAYKGDLQASLVESSSQNPNLKIAYFPNSVSDYLNLSISPELIDADYCVTDLRGKKVLFGKLSSLNSTLDFTIFPSGTYLLKVTGSEDLVYRIIKE